MGQGHTLTFEELGDGEQIFAEDKNIGVGKFDVVPFNWLQHDENIHDVAHFYWLHYLHSGPQFGPSFGEIDLVSMRRDLHANTSRLEPFKSSAGEYLLVRHQTFFWG